MCNADLHLNLLLVLLVEVPPFSVSPPMKSACVTFSDASLRSYITMLLIKYVLSCTLGTVLPRNTVIAWYVRFFCSKNIFTFFFLVALKMYFSTVILKLCLQVQILFLYVQIIALKCFQKYSAVLYTSN